MQSDWRRCFRALQSGEVEVGGSERTDPLSALLDAAMSESGPAARRLLAILEERGWRGWTRLEEVPGSANLGRS